MPSHSSEKDEAIRRSVEGYINSFPPDCISSTNESYMPISFQIVKETPEGLQSFSTALRAGWALLLSLIFEFPVGSGNGNKLSKSHLLSKFSAVIINQSIANLFNGILVIFSVLY